MFNNVQQGGARRQGRRWTEFKFERSSNLFFNTSTEASVAVDMVEGAECKREREATEVLLGTRLSLFGK